MPRGLQRFQESGQSHFLTFRCNRREARFVADETFDLFLTCLEHTRRRFQLCVHLLDGSSKQGRGNTGYFEGVTG